MVEGPSGRVIIDGAGTGSWNMAVDEAILGALATLPPDRPQAVLRFYRWEVPTLSLGYFQHIAERTGHDASRDCPLVRRPSGGGAILHDRELTYSLTVSAGFPGSRPSTQLYQAVHRALLQTLQTFGIEARLWAPPPGDQAPPQAASQPASREPFLCFQRRSEGDVILGDWKIAGSAQRRRLGAVLQHGSVLLEQSPQAPQLPGIAEITGIRLDVPTFAKRWQTSLEAELGCPFVADLLDSPIVAFAENLAESKFASTVWNERR